MQILVVADIHYSLRQFDWLVSNAGQFDLIIIAGDLLDIASQVELGTQILVVLKYLRKIAPTTPLLVSSGNHDLNPSADSEERVARWLARAKSGGTLVDGDHFQHHGILFSVLPWVEGPVTQARIEQTLEEHSKLERDDWVWIYHEPPQDHPVSWNGRIFCGDTQVVEWIQRYRPALVFSGHVHDAPFRTGGSWFDWIGGTLVFNAGYHMGPQPPFLIVDLQEKTATWHSQAGVETISIQPPSLSEVDAGG